MTQPDRLLYVYLPLLLLALGVMLLGGWLWLRGGTTQRWIGGLLIACGGIAYGSIGGHWAFGSVRYFWTLQWL